MSFNVNSTTATQERQHTSRVKDNGQNGDNRSNPVKKTQPKQEEDVAFLDLINQIETTGKHPETYGNIGRYRQYLDSLIEGLDQDGLDGFKRAKTAILNKEKRLSSLYAIHQADQAQAAEQEKEDSGDPRTKTGKKGKPVFSTLTEEDIDQFPDIEFLLSNILQETTVSMIFAESNTGKTFVALHTAQCIARGIPWLGRKVKQGNVLYIYAEGKLGMKPRLQAWRKGHDNLLPTNNLKFVAHPVHLIHDRDILLATVEEQEEPLRLVVIDTFSNCAIGTNQNDQMEVAKVLDVAHEIVRLYGCHVMFVHHTNNSGKVNGSAAFKNHVDTMIELKQSDALSPIVMSCEKQRDTERFSDIRLELRQIDLGINVKTLEPITSCIIQLSSVAGDKGLPPIQQTILDALGNDDLTYSQWESKAIAEGVKKPSFDNARKAVIKRGLVKKTEDDKRYCKITKEGEV